MSINNKNTDNSVFDPLKMVRAIAKEYLARPIIPKPGFEELLVDHPFFSTIFFSDGKMPLLLKDEEDVKKAKEIISRQIDGASSVSYIMMLIAKPYRLGFLNSIREEMTKEEFAEEFRQAWVSSEFPNLDPDISPSDYLNIFRDIGNEIMTEEEKEKIKSIPDNITVYRGVSRNGDSKAVSWTTSRAIAEWFADRFADLDRKVYSATCPKSAVLAYFPERGESEVIVDYTKLNNIECI